MFFFGCKEDKKEPQRTVDNTVVGAKKEDKKLLYIKCSQFENKKCLPGHTLEGSCAAKDENGRVYIEVDGKQLDMENGKRLKIYNFNNLWFFRDNFGFDNDETAGPSNFVGGDKPCVCEKEKEIPSGVQCKTVPIAGNCYVDLGNGIVDIQGYDIMGSLFGRIDAAFGENDLCSFFPTSRGDLITVRYIQDRFEEYKNTIITLFNTIKFGVVLAKNADEFKEYINKVADRFDEYYKLETDNYEYGMHQGKEKMTQAYAKELKRIAKVRKDLLEIVDVYKDALFMTEEQLSQNKIRRLAGFAEINPEDDDCRRYSL